MSVLLLILKIIGITLLSIIGLVLLVILLVLFVPIRYRADASYHEKCILNGKVTWLLHLVSLKAAYDDDGFTKHFRILGFDLLNRKKKERSKKQKKPKKSRKPKEEKPLDRLPEESEFTLEGFDDEQPETDTDKDPFTEQAQSDTEDAGFFAKLKEYVQKIADLINNFQDKVSAFLNKIKSMKGQFDRYYALIDNYRNREILSAALYQVMKALRAIRPRKWTANARFGFDDPATTGRILVILSILYPWTGKHLHVEPLYDEQLVEGDALVKGHVFLITLLIVGWKLYFNKDLKRLIRSLKKEA